VKELFAKAGPLRKGRPGTIIAILSTIHPRTVQTLADECKGSAPILPMSCTPAASAPRRSRRPPTI
jgi:hypothetical protein